MSLAITTAGLVNDWVSLSETLSVEIKDYQRIHDLGKEFEQSRLADVQYLPDDVLIKLTLKGMEQYQRENQGGFF